MDAKVVLETKNLSYTYPDGREALKSVNLKIYEGERLAVLGANGAGKSTLFLNLNGVYVPTEGEVILDGKRIGRGKRDLNKLREAVGIVFQNADNQIIASTVRGEVSFGPLNLGLSKKEVLERVGEALETMGITRFADRAPHYLSGGEKKRVGIADIIAMHPRVFIFDEPAAALDPAGARMLEDTLKILAESGKTLIISTHMVDFAWRWAQRVVVFNNGEVIADAEPIEVFKDKALLKTAQLEEPTLLKVTETLMETGFFPRNVRVPRDIHEFHDLAKKLEFEQNSPL